MVVPRQAPVPVLPEVTGRAALRLLPGLLRRMLPMLVLDGVLPLALYLVLRPRFAPASVVPLAVAVVFPLLGNALSLVRHRRLDTSGVLILLSLGASLGILLLGGNPRLLLITRMLVMPVMGLACLGSLVLPKPLAFYMVRQVLTGDEAQPGKVFDTLWQVPEVRAASRRMTLVWGLAMVGEFVVRVGFVLTLSVAQVLLLSSVVMMGMGLGLGVWNLAYGLHLVRCLRALALQPLPSVPVSPVSEVSVAAAE